MKRLTLLTAAVATLVVSSTGLAAPPSETAEEIVCRGTSGEGFSYEWGGECWCGNACKPDLSTCAAGTCTPTSPTGCPDCTHSGTYGADCSGFVSKSWQVPEPHPVDACNVPRFLASDFTTAGDFWTQVPMSTLQPADAVASSTHAILVIGAKDASGEHEVVEAKGCVYGIVRHSRTFSTSYSGARRTNITSCVCQSGDETQDCGDCGKQKRTCDGCVWSAWSACEGADPSGTGATCKVDGVQGACATGQKLCVAGWLTCISPSATTEVCDGQDNDCDGVVDNGTKESLGEGYACKAECGAGTSKCVGGKVQCVPAGATSCDGGSGTTHTNPVGANSGDSGGGCSCGMRAEAGTGSIAALLALLSVLARRRMSG
jgi:hypothetical protein